MMLRKGTPVYQYAGSGIRCGVIRSETRLKDGWQYYKVLWALEPDDDCEYRADALKVLNVEKEVSRLEALRKAMNRDTYMGI